MCDLFIFRARSNLFMKSAFNLLPPVNNNKSQTVEIYVYASRNSSVSAAERTNIFPSRSGFQKEEGVVFI